MIAAETGALSLDTIDRQIIAALTKDARLSDVELGERVGLSPSACARRVARLRGSGIITGSTVVLDLHRLGFGTAVMVNITLERQSEDTLRLFEAAVIRCPYVLSCHLMSGTDDYFIHVVARDVEDYERIHKQYLSKLPGVVRIRSSFSMRQIINRQLPKSIL